MNADWMIGKGMVEYLSKIGFDELRIDQAAKLGAVVKILTGVKSIGMGKSLVSPHLSSETSIKD